jgi:hypothetical protein
MKVFIKRLYNQNGQETGALISVIFGTPTNIQQKNIIENKLIQYAFDQLYPGEAINIYRDMYIDTPSITVIKNINSLPDVEIVI